MLLNYKRIKNNQKQAYHNALGNVLGPYFCHFRCLDSLIIMSLCHIVETM